MISYPAYTCTFAGRGPMPGEQPHTAEDRARYLEEIQRLVGRSMFDVSEGCLRLQIPLSDALKHVETSLLFRLLTGLRDYARLLVRAAATRPGEVVGDFLGGIDFDRPGDFVDLLADGGIRLLHMERAGDDVAEDVPSYEGVAVRVVCDDPAGELLDEAEAQVADDRVIRRELRVHVSPPWFVRATPPP